MIAQESEPQQRIKRINVAVNPDELAAITLLIERERISLTEAVRRLILYGEALYNAVAAGREVVLSGGGQPTQKLVLLDHRHRDLGAARIQARPGARSPGEGNLLAARSGAPEPPH